MGAALTACIALQALLSPADAYAADGNCGSGSGSPWACFVRSGSDQIMAATLSDIGNISPTYDLTYGYLTSLTGDNYALHYGYDAYTGKQSSQTLYRTGSSDGPTALFNAAQMYDAYGRLIQRVINDGQPSPTTGNTTYWYGPQLLKPLVVERSVDSGNADGKPGRIVYLGDEVLAIEPDSSVTETRYPLADHLGSIRVVLDGAGTTQQSLGYDEWGRTSVSGAASAVEATDIDLLFRFQGIEQQIFPLTALGVDDSAALAWLDGLAQYHYHGREYAGALASFLDMDPRASSVSPYGAFSGNPANFIDPDGMAARSWSAALGRALGNTDELQDFVIHMRKSGIQKVIVSEAHEQQYLLDIVGRLLSGARSLGPVNFWGEMNFGDDKNFQTEVLSGLQRMYAKQASSYEQQRLMLYFVAALHKDVREENLPFSPDVKIAFDRMIGALLRDDVVADFMLFHDATRTDITNFIRHPGFAIARMGKIHAEFYSTDDRQLVAPYLSGEEAKRRITAPSYLRLAPPKFHEIWNAFSRAVAKAPNVMMVIPGTSYDFVEPASNRATILSYYRKKGYAVLEVPISAGPPPAAPGYNVTIVAPSMFTPAILEFIDKVYYPERINFNCTGLPGCPVQKGEL